MTELFRCRYANDEMVNKDCITVKCGTIEKLINPNVQHVNLGIFRVSGFFQSREQFTCLDRKTSIQELVKFYVVIIFILFTFNSGEEGSLDTRFTGVCALELSERY